MIDFVFNETIEKELEEGKLLIKGIDKNNLSTLKGYATNTGEILVNLSASQWKGLDESFLIREIGKTIVHEMVHTLNDCVNDEKVCQILAGQL